MLPRTLILHGLYGNTADHWQTLLDQDLKRLGVPVAYPELPGKDAPVLVEWLAVFDNLMDVFRPEVLVCHSLGVLLTLHALTRNPSLVFQKIALVAPPAFNQPIEEAATFFPVPEIKVADRARELLLVASDNDPWCPLAESRRIETVLGVMAKRLPGKGHINPEAGFGPWSDMTEWVLSDR